MCSTELYEKYCRPDLAKLLQAVRLDRVFHKAHGDIIYYHDENGEEIGVIDFLGGYGSLLFGHNHPSLIQTAISQLQENQPFSAQGSIRQKAALLGEALNRMMEKSTGKSYITTLCNTGTEAVEAAIKHAELFHSRKISAIVSNLTKGVVILKKLIESGRLTLPKTVVESLADEYGRSWDALIHTCQQRLKSEPVFLCLRRSFHGKTSGSLKMTHNETYRKPFERIGIHVRFINADNSEHIDQAIREMTISYVVPEIGPDKTLVLAKKHYVNIAAMFIEPLQGEGGIRPISDDFLAHARTCSQENGFPLIFDEIQCGMGRTGTFLFSERSGVVADYYLLSKSLGGGLSKIAALIVQRDAYDPEFGILHTSTFAEDDHSAGIALEALRILESDPLLMINAQKKGDRIKDGLNRIKEAYPGVIKEIRGQGLMLGIEFESQEFSGSNFIRATYLSKLLGAVIAGYYFNEHRIRIAPVLSDVVTIRIEPSFYISEDQCETFLDATDRLCEILYKQNFYALIKYIVGLEEKGTAAVVTDLRQEQIVGTAPDDLPKVAFLGHLIDPDHLKLVDGSFRVLSRDQLEYFVEKTYEHIPPQLYDQKVVTSITGKQVVLNFIGLHIIPTIIERAMRKGDPGPVADIVSQGVELAIELGCEVVGFGGYTSIITGNCMNVITDKVALTSGNSLTVAMGIESLFTVAEENGMDLSRSCLAGVGATGNICSTYMNVMSEAIPEIMLIARNGNGKNRLNHVAGEIISHALESIRAMREQGGSVDRLTAVAREIYDTAAVKSLLERNKSTADDGLILMESLNREMKDRMPVRCTSDLSVLKHANLIIGATNTPGPVIFPEHLNGNQVVINDIAVPSDVDNSVRNKENVTVIMGGIVKLPCNPDFTITGMPLHPGYAYACMSETILMGLSGIRENYSYGRINNEQVKTIRDIAKTHGFTLGMPKTCRSY